MVNRVHATLEDLLLVRAEQLNELFSAVPVDRSRLGDIVSHRGQEILVELNQMVETAFGDIERAQTRQEIIADEEAEEDEVVDDSLYVKSEPQLAVQLLVLQHHVLSQQRDVNQLEVICAAELDALDAARCLVALDDVLLANDREVRLVRQQAEHDQVSVRAVEAMPRVRVVSRPLSQLSDIVEHLVFSFAGH